MKIFPGILSLGLALLVSPAWSATIPVYLGTYTSADGSEGIYRTGLDLETGDLLEPALVAKLKNPSFLALHSGKKTLFAVGESGESEVASYRIEKDGGLSLLSRQPTGGAASCHLALDEKDRFVVVASYSGSKVTAFPVKPDGSVEPASDFKMHEGSGANPKRQEKPHPHGIHFGTGTSFYVPDLGTDRVEFYDLDDAGKMRVAAGGGFSVPAGSGPRHCAVDGERVWVLNELSCTVLDAVRAGDGKWKLGEPVSTLPSDWKGQNTCAEIIVHPGGRFLYATNRGHDSIARFEILKGGGVRFLGTTPCGGKVPRSAALSPDGRWLVVANQDSGNVLSYAVDAATGELTQKGKAIGVSKAVCVLFAGGF